MSDQIKSVFEKLGYIVLLNKSLPLNKAFILHNIEHKTYSFNLSGFMIYDILVDEKPKELLELLFEFNESNYDINKFNTRRLLLNELRNMKYNYEGFKEIINVEKIFINSTIHKPINEQFIIEKGNTYLNLYEINNNFENVKPDLNSKFPLIEEFLLNACGQDIGFYNKFLEVCAWKLQFPLQMLSQCNFIFQDKGGTGKSEILLDMILKKLYNVNIISQSHLESDFNSYMVNSQWIVVEEVEGFKDAKKIKNLTGAKTLMINQKNVPIYETVNYNNFIIFSNELKTLQLDENDRRFNVGGGGLRLSPRPSDTWKNTYFKSKENNVNYFKKLEKNLDSEINNLYSYLSALKVQRVEVQQLVNTKQRDELINLGKTSEKLFLDDIKSLGLDGVLKLIDYRNVRAVENLIYSDEGKNYILYKDIYSMYEKYHTHYMGRKTGLIGKNFLISRLMNYSVYEQLFDEYKRICFVDNDPRALRFVAKKFVMDEDFDKEELMEEFEI